MERASLCRVYHHDELISWRFTSQELAIFQTLEASMRNADNVFSARGVEVLGEFLNSPRSLVAFDFDGTLAPIVSTPADALMERDVHEELARFARISPVLIISGRSVGDVRNRVPAEVTYLLGNHGLEGSSLVTESLLRDARLQTKSWLEVLQARLGEDPRFVLEDKDFSISIHFRKAASQKSARLYALREAYALKPTPSILDGKSVVNVLPSGLPDKYIALKGLMAEKNFEKAIFIGDDVTDNQVFRARDNAIMSIRIGTNRDLLADYFLETQADMRKFISLIQYLLASNSRNKSEEIRK